MLNYLKVTKLVKEADLRRVHVYRERYSKKLKEGEAVLLINFACDKIRFIDRKGGVHNYYAPSGEVFDVPQIQEHVRALRLFVQLSWEVRAYLNDWEEAA